MTSSSIPPPQKAAVSLQDGWVPSMNSQMGVSASGQYVCMYGVGQHPLLTCHGPAMNDVGEAGYFLGGEVPRVTI